MGADPNLQSDSNYFYLTTALMQAASISCVSVAKLLLDYGADPNIKNKEGYFTDVGKTALMIALKSSWTGNIVQPLLENGADPNIQDIEGKTALMMALEEEKEEDTVQLLLDYGANPNIQNKWGETAFTFAKNKQIVTLLKKAQKGVTYYGIQ